MDRVNGQKISRLEDLQEALKRSINGRHVIEFMQRDSLRKMVQNGGVRMVVAAVEEERDATARI